MAEPRKPAPVAMALAAAALVLTLLTAVGGVLAAVAGVAAQPLLALLARDRRRPRPFTRARLRAELPPLATLWGVTTAGVAVLLAWPVSALLRSGALGPAMGVSVAVGIVLVVLWRLWPLWQGLERDGGALGDHWRALDGLEPGAWRGLGVATAVAAVAALVILLAWPSLLAGAARWALVLLLLGGSVALHLWLQRVRPAAALSYLDELEEELEGDRLEHAVEAAAPAAAEPAVAVHAAAPQPVLPGASAKAAVEAPLEPLEPALYDAARNGRVELALELLDAGADPHAPPPEGDRDQRSLPVLAAVLPDLRLLRALIARGVDLNRPHAGMTPLLAATRDSWHGRPDAVTTLLANGADPRASDAVGNTPLHFAARSSDPGVAALLRDAAAELEVLNHDGLSPLGVACAAGNWRLARFLLERGARPEPVDGQPALLAAAGGEDDDPAGVLLLLKMKARVGARDPGGRTALHEAAAAGHAETVAALLAAGAEPAVADATGATPLHEAARSGHAEVLRQLLARLGDGAGAVVAAADGDGRDVLTLACMAEPSTPELVRQLLASGADPARRDNDGRRAVDHAAAAGRWALVAELDPAHPLPAGAGGEVDAGPARAPAAMLREGLEQGREGELDEIAALLSARELGALLHDGEATLPPHQVQWLAARGADLEVRDGVGDTPLFVLLGRGPRALPTLRALLALAASPAGRGGLARYLASCLRGQALAEHEAFALQLLDHGADPFGRGGAGDPPLPLAIRLGWGSLVERLLDSGVDLDARDSHGMSALHLAAALGREPLLRRLVAHGADPELLAADGQSPLGVALAAGRRDLADWLDWRGWPLPRRRLRPSDLPTAAIVGDADAVRRLLDLGLPVDAVDAQGCSALLRAAGGGHLGLVDLLLARGADAGRAADSGATALSAAVSMRHGEVVDRLIAAGTDVEQRLPGGLTVLMVACALGLPDLAARLLGAGAEVRAVDDEGRAPLHCAAMFGFGTRDRSRLVALLDTLLLAGAEADVDSSAGGATPLLLLLGARAEPGTAADEEVLAGGLELLLDNDARLDVQDPRGFGPLHLAALHGLPAVVKWLLRAGADPELRDSLNRTPREIAVMRGFVDIAAEFGPARPGGDVSMARFLRDRS